MQISLRLTPAEVADRIRECDGILLPGSGADVNPQKYGQDPLEFCAPADSARENVDELLLQDAHNLYKPVLGICFGHQSLNVWRGGTLVQHLTVLPVNHAAGNAVAVAHGAKVTPNSVLGRLLTSDEAPLDGGYLRLLINSSHHQAIGVPGDGLRVVARCPQDDVIEAVEGGQNSEGSAHFVVGVQWHPERSYLISQASRALFERFVFAVRDWKPRAVNRSVA